VHRDTQSRKNGRTTLTLLLCLLYHIYTDFGAWIRRRAYRICFVCTTSVHVYYCTCTCTCLVYSRAAYNTALICRVIGGSEMLPCTRLGSCLPATQRQRCRCTSCSNVTGTFRLGYVGLDYVQDFPIHMQGVWGGRHALIGDLDYTYIQLYCM
jgi:hypothetical protein